MSMEEGKRDWEGRREEERERERQLGKKEKDRESIPLQETHLFNLGRSHSHTKTPAAYGWDDLAGRVTAENDTARGHVFLHGPSQSMLSIPRQLVHLCQHHNYIQSCRVKYCHSQEDIATNSTESFAE